MFNATSTNMQGRTSTYMDKSNYTVRFDINLVYAYLRSYRGFDFHTLLSDLSAFVDDYKLTVGQVDISTTFPDFSVFFGKTSSGEDIGLWMAVPYGIDSDGNKFDIFLIGQMLSDSEIDAYKSKN